MLQHTLTAEFMPDYDTGTYLASVAPKMLDSNRAFPNAT